MPYDSALHTAAIRFADIVKYKSKGSVEVDIICHKRWRDDQQIIDATLAGELAVIITPINKLRTLVPASQYFDLLFLFPGREDTHTMLDNEPGRIFFEQLKPFGLTGVTFWETGFKQFSANREIKYPKDFIGLKIGDVKGRIVMDQFKALGALPLTIDLDEIYQALKLGVIDGTEGTLSSIYNMKFHEVQSHLTISNNAYVAHVFCFSTKKLESLPSDIRELLVSTAREVTSFERREVIITERRILKTIQEAGVTIHFLSQEERDRFRKATDHIIEESKEVIGIDILDKTTELLKKITPAKEVKF